MSLLEGPPQPSVDRAPGPQREWSARDEDEWSSPEDLAKRVAVAGLPSAGWAIAGRLGLMRPRTTVPSQGKA